jgi:hemolysin III
MACARRPASGKVVPFLSSGRIQAACPPPAIYPYVFRHPVSAASHLLFCAFCAYAAALLWRAAEGPVRRRSVLAFGASAVVLYAASGLYHVISADRPALVALFLRLDLAAIHVLIAGTMTPLLAVLLEGRVRRLMLALVWAVALVGVGARLLLPPLPFALTVGLYAATAVGGVLPVLPLLHVLPPRTLGWLVAGAAAYAAGATCEALRWPVLLPGVVGPHEVLHTGDMIGTSCHLVFVARLVLQTKEPRGWRETISRPAVTT